MTKRSKLMLGAAMGVVLAAAFVPHADAADRDRLSAAASAETRALKMEVEALRTQVEALTARLDAQVAARRQVAAGAQSIITLPATVETATRQPTVKPGWWGDTRVGGIMFSDISHIDNRNVAGKTAQSGVDYDIKRMYLIVEHRFDDTYSFNLTTDFTFDSSAVSPSGAASPTPNEAGGANTAGGVRSTQLFIKKAYLQAHYSDAFNVRLGSAELPWVPFVENFNGYRFVEQMLIDRVRFGTTTDWGVHLYGSMFDHMIGYQVSVIDGEGFRQPAIGTANRTHAVDVEGRVNATYNHFTLAVGGYDGKLGGDVAGVRTYHDAQRFDALAAYADAKARVGFEYMWARYWRDVTQAKLAKTNGSDAYSVFASWNLTPKVSMFGRYDYVKPQADTTPSEHENFFDVGLSYKPITALDLALVYKRDSVLDGSLSTSDGVIGIPKGAVMGKGVYDEFGLFTQVKF